MSIASTQADKKSSNHSNKIKVSVLFSRQASRYDLSASRIEGEVSF